MREISQRQMKSGTVRMNYLAKLLEKLRFAVRAKPHHFVFVAEFQKSQILRDRAVVESQRMGKRYRSMHVHPPLKSRPPHRTRKIAKPVRGKQRRLSKRRAIE